MTADDYCDKVLKRVNEFIDHELDEASSDEIRAHLAACELCLDEFDVEQAVKSLVHRCCQGEKAPQEFRVRLITVLTRRS